MFATTLPFTLRVRKSVFSSRVSGNGTIRKKNQLLTKQSDSDMKCFSIKHFASLDYIAEKKKKAFLIIKKQRQKLKTLNYLELNTLRDMKDINNM
jgi:hypothetical protein